MKLRHDSKADYIIHILEMVAASQQLIAAAERRATLFPSLSDECGEVIAAEKRWLRIYQKYLEDAYALPNEKN